MNSTIRLDLSDRDDHEIQMLCTLVSFSVIFSRVSVATTPPVQNGRSQHNMSPSFFFVNLFNRVTVEQRIWSLWHRVHFEVLLEPLQNFVVSEVVKFFILTTSHNHRTNEIIIIWCKTNGRSNETFSFLRLIAIKLLRIDACLSK